MLIEVPNMASCPHESSYLSKKTISKTFRKIYDGYSKLIFTGPPESNRDFVVAASKSLFKGEYKQAIN